MSIAVFLSTFSYAEASDHDDPLQMKLPKSQKKDRESIIQELSTDLDAIIRYKAAVVNPKNLQKRPRKQSHSDKSAYQDFCNHIMNYIEGYREVGDFENGFTPELMNLITFQKPKYTHLEKIFKKVDVLHTYHLKLNNKQDDDFENPWG